MFQTTKTLFPTILLALLLLPPAAAQESDVARQTDSILALLPQLPDAEKLDAIYTLVDINDEASSAKPYIDMLLAEARRQKNIEMEGDALHSLVYHYYFRFDSDSIFIIGEEAIEFLQRHKLYGMLIPVKNNLIYRHFYEGRTITALRMAEEFYDEIKEIQDEWMMVEVLQTMANIYEAMEQYEEALRIFEQCIEMARKTEIKRDNFLAHTYSLMVSVAYELKRFEDALLYTDSVQIELEIIKRNFPERNLQQQFFMMESDRVMAYAQTNRHELALQALRRMEDMFDPQWEGTPHEAMQLHTAYYYFYHLTGNYQKAMEHLNSTLQYVETGTENIVISHWYNMLKARLHFDMGDYRQAAQTAFNVIEGRDSLNTQRFATQINELRTIYELDKLELEAVRKQARIRQQHIINIASLGGCFLLAFIVVCVAWNRKRLKEKNRGLISQLTEQDRLEDELTQRQTTIGELQKRLQLYETIETADFNPEKETFEKLDAMMKQEMLFTAIDLKQKDVADKTGTTEKKLAICIKSATGMTYSEYINHLRLNHSRKLLLNYENYTIEAVAAETGFTRSNFYRLFKEKFKVTPDEYRNGKKALVVSR